MNSAEFKTLREAVGLSVSNVANLANVGERTVRYWEAGRNSPPQEISNRLSDINEMLERSANEAIKIYEEKMPDEVVLYRYVSDKELHKAHKGFKDLPVTVHAALLFRVKHYLNTLSVPVSIEYKQ